MGMRFDKVKTSDWVNLGNALGGAYVQGKAADANAEGMRQSTQTTSNYGTQDPNAVYVGAGSDGSMTNAEAASYGVSVPAEDKSAGTGVQRQYGLGSNPQQWQSTEYTPDQQRLGGLRAQMAFYDGRGDTDKSNRIRAQIDAGATQDREKTKFDQEQRAYQKNEEFWDNQTGTQGVGLAPQGSGPAPQGSGPAPQGSGPAPQGSGPAPQASKEMQALLRDLRMAEHSRVGKDVTAAHRAIDGLTFTEALNGAVQASAARPLSAKEAGARALSDAGEIPGKMIVTGPQGKDPGSIVYISAGGEPVRISHEEADKLTALYTLRKDHPERVAAEISKLDAGAKTVAAALFERTHKTNTLAETARHNGVTERNDSARVGIARQNANRGEGKTVSPELTQKINDVVVRYQNSTDPKERATLEREFNILQGQGATQLGRPMQLKTAAPERPAVPLKDVIELANMYNGQPDPDAPKKTMNAQRAMQVARQELGGGQATPSASDAFGSTLPMDDPRKTRGQAGTGLAPQSARSAPQPGTYRVIQTMGGGTAMVMLTDGTVQAAELKTLASYGFKEE